MSSMNNLVGIASKCLTVAHPMATVRSATEHSTIAVVMDTNVQGCKKSSTFLTPKFYYSNLPTFSGNINPYFATDTRARAIWIFGKCIFLRWILVLLTKLRYFQKKKTTQKIAAVFAKIAFHATRSPPQVKIFFLTDACIMSKEAPRNHKTRKKIIINQTYGW